jgi:hypothetical protein
MRAAAAILVLALLIAASCGGGGGEGIPTATTETGETGTEGTTGGDTGTQAGDCAERAGEIVSLLPVAQRKCTSTAASVESGDMLVGGDELTTSDSPSTVRFDVDLVSSSTAHCGMGPDAAARIRPNADTDLDVSPAT